VRYVKLKDPRLVGVPLYWCVTCKDVVVFSSDDPYRTRWGHNNENAVIPIEGYYSRIKQKHGN